jgi:hypothetical protein
VCLGGDAQNRLDKQVTPLQLHNLTEGRVCMPENETGKRFMGPLFGLLKRAEAELPSPRISGGNDTLYWAAARTPPVTMNKNAAITGYTATLQQFS